MVFVGEGAIDTGGPRREFLRLLAKQLSNGPYFQSGEDGSFFACNTTGYQVCGLIMQELCCLCCMMLPFSTSYFIHFVGQPLQDTGAVCSYLRCTGWLRISFFPSESVYIFMHRYMVTSCNSKCKYPDPELRDLISKVNFVCIHVCISQL